MPRLLPYLLIAGLLGACTDRGGAGGSANSARITARAAEAEPITYAAAPRPAPPDSPAATTAEPQIPVPDLEMPVSAPRFDSVAIAAPQLDLPNGGLRTGALDGTGNEVFGLIKDLAVDRAGRIAVADAHNLEIRLFDPNGKFLTKAGREGRGPREFRAIEAVALSPAGDLLVVDPGNRRILRFALSDSAVGYIGETALPLIPFDVCVMEGRTFVASPHRERVLHEIALDGSLIRSFGGMVRGEGLPPGLAEDFAETLSAGQIVCSEQHRLLVFIPHSAPEVRAFAPDGTLRWRSTLPDWSQMGIQMVPRERPTSRITLDSRTNATSHSVAATLLPTEHLIVQVALDKLEYRIEEAPITTYVLSLRDGHIVRKSATVPLIAQVRPPFVYAYSNDPYPTFSVLRSDTISALAIP